MRIFDNRISRLVFVTSLFAFAASAATIFDSGVTALVAGDPTQLGRINRNGVISDWSATKAFPGAVNTSTSYHFHEYDVAIPVYFPYVQITIDDISGAALVFASAYTGAYSPNPIAVNRGLDVNYLGDAGRSGNLAGTNPLAFQVVMPSASDLIVVINDTSNTGGGVGNRFDILVEGFTDTQFDDTIPEPTTVFLTAAGLLSLVLFPRRAAKV